MKFEIQNNGEDWNHDHIEIIEAGQKSGKRLSTLKKGGKMTVDVGPFMCKNEDLLEKTYSLYYKDGEEMIRFGHKFGFTVRGVKRGEMKKNVKTEQEREKIRDLKVISGSLKSEEYLNLKLKSLGIDVLNLQMDDESIV